MERPEPSCTHKQASKPILKRGHDSPLGRDDSRRTLRRVRNTSVNTEYVTGWGNAFVLYSINTHTYSGAWKFADPSDMTHTITRNPKTKILRQRNIIGGPYLLGKVIPHYVLYMWTSRISSKIRAGRFQSVSFKEPNLHSTFLEVHHDRNKELLMHINLEKVTNHLWRLWSPLIHTQTDSLAPLLNLQALGSIMALHHKCSERRMKGKN